MMEPMEVVTVWLAIDPSTRANGCMKVIPRTHEGGYSDYDPVDDKSKAVFATEIRKTQRDESRAVYLELEPNQASLHTADSCTQAIRTHRMRRCGYTMRYVTTRTKFNQEKVRRVASFLPRPRQRPRGESLW